MVQQVFIEYIVDDTGLDSAQAKLEHTGAIDKATADQFKKTNAELQKRQQVMSSTGKVSQQAATQTKKSIDDLDKAVLKMSQDFIEGFQEGVQEELKKAGVSAEEFGAALKAGEKSTGSLKQQLRSMTQELAEMKVRGDDNTEQYRQLAQEAGQLQDAIGDAAQEVRNFASDTSTLDGVIGIAQGLAGGFAVAQGAAALFGDESEELQETLLRVNAAMAVLQGLQQVANILQKESAAATLLTNVQRKIQNAQLIIENALQSQSIVVRGAATVAQKLLNAAMAANPIGIVVVALAGLITLLATYGRSAANARRQTASLNATLNAGAAAFEEREDAIRRQSEATINALENEGAVGSRIAQQEIENQKLAADARKERLAELRQLQQQTTEAELEQRLKLQEEIRRLADEEISDRIEANNLQKRLELELRQEQLQGIANNLEARLVATRKNSAQELALSKQLARARADIELNEAGQDVARQTLIRANLLKELRALDLQYARVRQEDRIAALEVQLVAEERASRAINERVSQTEIDLQKRLIQEKARLDLMQEGLTANQRISIQVKALAEISNLQKEFNQQSARESLEDFISSNNAQLQQLNISNEERLRLTEENIIAQAEIELQANRGLSDKIKEITAKRDADIRALRLQTIQQTLQYELDSETARTGVLRRANERIAASERRTLAQRIAAINQLAALDIAAINAKQDALERQLEQGLISQRDYNLQYAQLKDEEARITEETELKKRALYKQTEQQRIANAIEVSTRLLDIIQQFGDNAAEREQIRIDTQRQQIEALKEAGAITEKDAERRQKQLEIEERKAKTQQAKRERDIALFRALLAIPQAYLQGMAQGGPILAAIYAALAGVQVGIIASKPIPKFGKGKKNSYEGLAEVGETGAELVESNGQMYVAPKRTIVWLGKKDKVYNPQETIAMLDKRGVRAASIDKYKTLETVGTNINYDKLGKIIGQEVGKNIPQTGFNFDDKGFTSYVQGQTSFTKYLNQRRSY